MKVANAFSLQMVSQISENELKIKVKKLTVDEVRDKLAGQNVESCVGHPDIADVMSDELGTTIAMNPRSG